MAESTDGPGLPPRPGSSEPGREPLLPEALGDAAVDTRLMSGGRTITYYRWPRSTGIESGVEAGDDDV